MFFIFSVKNTSLLIIPGPALHLCCSSTRYGSPKFVIHCDSVLQRPGFERQRPSLWSYELQWRVVREHHHRFKCHHRQCYRPRFWYVISTFSMTNFFREVTCLQFFLQVTMDDWSTASPVGTKTTSSGSLKTERFWLQKRWIVKLSPCTIWWSRLPTNLDPLRSASPLRFRYRSARVILWY